MYAQTQVLHDSDLYDLPPVNSRDKLGILKTVDRDYEIFLGENCIGRAEICDIVINHPTISGKHAIITVEDQECHFIYDCGSTNKTKLGKLKLIPSIRYNLQDGDVITFGDLTATYIKVNETPARFDDDSGSDTGSESLFCDSIVPETPNQTKLVNLIPSEIIVAEDEIYIVDKKQVTRSHPISEVSTDSKAYTSSKNTDTETSNDVYEALTQVNHNFLDDSKAYTSSKNTDTETSNDVYEALTQVNHNFLDDSKACTSSKNTDTETSNDVYEALTQVNHNFLDDSKACTSSKNTDTETSNDVYEALTQVNHNFLDDSKAYTSSKNTDTETSNDVYEALTQVNHNFLDDSKAYTSSKNTDIETINDFYEAFTQVNLNFLDKNGSRGFRDVQDNTDDDEGEIYNATQIARSHPISEVSTDSKACTSSKNTDTETINDVYEALTQLNHNFLDKNGSRRFMDVQDNTDDDKGEMYNAKTKVARNYPICEISTYSIASTSIKNIETKISNDVYQTSTQVYFDFLDNNGNIVFMDVQDNTDDDEGEIYNFKTQVARSYSICEVSDDSIACTSIKNIDTKISNDVYQPLTQVNHNKKAILKTSAINNPAIDEENHESESILSIVSDDMDDEENLFEVRHSNKNKNLLDCVSNKQLKNNNEISKTEVSVSDNLSNDEMISEYSENSFNFPPSDVLLEATSTPGKKPLYTEDEEEIINSSRAKRRTTRIRKPTNNVLNHLHFRTTIKKAAEKKNFKKTNDSMCIEKAQKEAVKIKKAVVKLKQISVAEIEFFTGQSKLKENNSKEILGDRVTSSLKSENAVKKYSAEELLFEDEKEKLVFSRKTKGENNLTDNIPVKKSKLIATQKHLSTIITVDLEELNEEDYDLETLSKIKKRGRNLKNLTSKSKRAKYESCIQPETGVTIIEPNSSVVYDSLSSCINTKTDSLLVECTTSYKSEKLNSKANKVNKIVKKNTTAQRKRNIDDFFLSVASMSRLKDSVSCDSKDKTSSFSNNSGSSIHSISARTTRNINRKKEQVLFTTDMSDPKLMAIVTKLGCTIVNSPQTCTVLVASEIRRTVKVLCCIGRGIPIVSPYWIEESKYVGIVQDPWKFLIVDKEAENKHYFSLKESLNMANKVPLLKNYSFHATPSVRPPPCEFRGIVEACGGAFLDEIPKLWPENSVIISCNEDRNLWEKMKSNTVPLIVTAEAILGGIMQQNLNLSYHTLS